VEPALREQLRGAPEDLLAAVGRLVGHVPRLAVVNGEPEPYEFTGGSSFGSRVVAHGAEGGRWPVAAGHPHHFPKGS
jgi:hypothetical protein